MIVETGAIVPDANSYITLAFFDAYWLDRGVAPAHDDLSKEAAIIVATQYVDSVNRFKGEIVSETQSLAWPRQGAHDSEGRAIPSDAIPAKLKQAVAEYAKRQLDSALLPDVSDTGAIKSKRDKLGDLETETVYQDGTGGYFGIKRYPMADNLLKGLTVSSGMGRLYRV
jgi:hypothetical protein